jgi:hypothetical protein
MFCTEGFTAHGMVSLLGAHIGGQLFFTGASLANPTGLALLADGLTVDQDMACTDGFTAQGGVSLSGAHIGKVLTFGGAILSNPDGMALNLERSRAETLVLLFQAVPDGTVDLANTHVNVCYDDQATWPRDLHLNGFSYGDLVASREVDAKARIRWLRHDAGGYTPQLYEQLAAAYRKAGRDDYARKVAIGKQRHRRETLDWPGKMWNSLLRWTIGYGYRTWQAGLLLLGFLLIDWLVFTRAYPADMTPTKQVGEPLPHFQPLIYALDTLLPVVDLHQQDNWLPLGLVQWWAWTSILAGWVLTTAVVAALTGLVKND